jgi:AAA+ ATPase superfamily predicted ATPase
VSLFFLGGSVLFYGREAELKKLNEMYGSGRLQAHFFHSPGAYRLASERRQTVFNFVRLQHELYGKSVRDNIISLFLTPSGHFFEEPANLLKQELRESSTYNGIIGAIAAGASRLNEIAAKCGIESNKCAKYLGSLMALGIVKKENPVCEKGGKKSVYLLEDQMFCFWYRFVFPNLSAIEAGLGEGVYGHDVEPRLNAYMGPVFEEICKQYLFLRARENALPFFIGKLGRWRGNNPRTKRQEEIDIMAFRGDNAIFGECKWTNAPVGMDALTDLREQSRLFDYKNIWFYLFAKSGFTENLAAEAEKCENVISVCFEDMLRS